MGKEWTLEGQKAWREELFDFYGDDADEELLCIPSKGGGVYLPRHLIEACMRKESLIFRYACPDGFEQRPEEERVSETLAWCDDYLLPALEALDQNLRHSFGEDFARSGDLTVIWPIARCATHGGVSGRPMRSGPGTGCCGVIS